MIGRIAKRLALIVADRLLVYVGSGDHTAGYDDAVSDALRAVRYVRGVFYPKRRQRPASYWKVTS